MLVGTLASSATNVLSATPPDSSEMGAGGPVRRGSPGPAACPTEGLPTIGETCGRAVWLGTVLFASVPETGHNASSRHAPRAVRFARRVNFFVAEHLFMCLSPPRHAKRACYVIVHVECHVGGVFAKDQAPRLFRYALGLRRRSPTSRQMSPAPSRSPSPWPHRVWVRPP
jgi:hypothetical protein